MTRRILAVVLASAAAAACGGTTANDERSAKLDTPRPHPVTVVGPPGKLVAIGGGRSLFLHCVGSGSPAVVLEAGFGADTMEWRAVQPELGRTTRACAYDRAGFGNSVAPPGLRDARDEVRDLRQLLAGARIAPPYVLVGHSYGGVVGRVFAHLHPGETAGLVLIDTMGRGGRRRQLAVWPKSQAPATRRELASIMDGVDLAAGEAVADRLRTLDGVPLAVITAARHDNFPRRPRRLRRALTRLWTTMQDELARLSTDSVHVVALRSNHQVPSSQSGQPAVVARAVQAVVRAARDRTPLPACRVLFTGPGTRCRR